MLGAVRSFAALLCVSASMLAAAHRTHAGLTHTGFTLGEPAAHAARPQTAGLNDGNRFGRADGHAFSQPVVHPNSSAPGAQAGASAPPLNWQPSVAGSPSLSPALDDLELAGRLQPALALAQVERWLQDARTGSRWQWDLLRLRAQFLLDLERPEAARAVVEQLRESPVETGLSLVEPRVVAACLEGVLAYRGYAPLPPAHALLQEWLPQMPVDMPVAQRLNCLSASAAVAERLRRFDEAVNQAQEAQRLAERLGGWRVPLMLGRLGRVLHRAGDTEAGLRMVDEALAMAQQQVPKSVVAELSILRAVLLPSSAGEAEYQTALEQALEAALRWGSARDQALALANMSDQYLSQRQWQRTCDAQQSVRQITREMPYALAEEIAESNCGLALIQQHRLADGMAYLRRFLDQYRRTDDVAGLSESLQELGANLESAGYDKEALEAFLEDQSLARERFRRNQAMALQEALEAFDAERRRRDRAMLLAENQLKSEDLDQRELQWREWALASGIVALLLAGLALWYSRLRTQQRHLQLHQDQLRAESEQDPLTGLANRRHVQRLLELQGGAPNRCPEGTLYLIDLDHFKRVNDVYGHSGGDRVLVEVARRLRAVLREQDLIARWGGEEFLVLVGPRSQESGEALAQRLLAALALMPVAWGDAHIPLSASIGYASFPLGTPHLPPWEVALRLVDAALYLAKTDGRNRACGVRHLPLPLAEGEWQTWAALAERLEAAWRAGEVEVNMQRGPAPAGQPWATPAAPNGFRPLNPGDA